MPENITIGAFVFGAISVLIALLGGRFKIFGAEAPRVARRTVRWVAGLADSVLIFTGHEVA